MENWIDLLKKHQGVNNSLQINKAASEEELAAVERALHVKLPAELKSFLSTANGDSWLFFSAKQIIDNNINTKKALEDSYDNLEPLLFFAGNGCGDYFAYEILGESSQDHIILRWNHENNSRDKVADDLSDLIQKYYTDQI